MSELEETLQSQQRDLEELDEQTELLRQELENASKLAYGTPGPYDHRDNNLGPLSNLMCTHEASTHFYSLTV